MGGVRHFGVTFMAFIAALWLQQLRTSRVSAVARALLAVSAASGIGVAYAQWIHPFSNAGAAARWLEQNHLQHAAIVGSPDSSVAAVAEELGRPVYFLDCACSDTFLKFSNRRDSFDASQIAKRTADAAQKLGSQELILTLTRPIEQREVDELAQLSFRATPLVQFTGSVVPDEDFFLYTVRRF